MDWSAVNWLNLSVFTASAFVAALAGGFIGRRNYTLTAFLTAIFFAGIYIGWSGYLKQQLDQASGASEMAREKKPEASQSMEKGVKADTESTKKVQQ